ncbi:methyl-accepting chemotaxis protein [Shewanella intestini]|uniref:Methyl-accepting chemotaxis protein n=1 Tax=Shewanella intestini TaxID=2017544 RepID=A0ABS5HYR9_9GAMM|nr:MULTISPECIES: methyl-accepting chemotaxis protein [Shewanella]MBR9726871.1 methyl-accepting chemotaxis protein [Shewanella intestini]MRG34563.1 chemotaxis protein [Shewanella sp. XMDDZSB0408]
MRLQWIGNLSMPKKLALMILPPLFAFIVYGGMFVDNKYQSQNQLHTVLTLSNLSVVNGALVHELQKERGMSAGFIGSQGRSFANTLPQQRIMTDQQVGNYRAFIKDSVLPRDLTVKLEDVNRALQNLSNMRHQVDNLTVSVADEVAYYTKMNTTLLSLVDSAAQESQNSELSIKIKAFGAFLQLKERAGIERAVLSTTFGQAGFKPNAYRKFITLVSEQNTYAERFKASASEQMNRQFDGIMSGSEVRAVQRLRQIAFEQNSADIQAQSPEKWFQTSTDRIGVLTAFEQQLATDLINHTETELSRAQTQMYVAISFLVLLIPFVLLMSIGLSRYLHNSLQHIQEQVVYAGEHADMSIRLQQHYDDEFGHLARAFNLMMDDFEGIISKVKHTSASLLTVVEQVNQLTLSLKQDVDNGYSEVEQVASAMTEMSATVNDIAQHAVSTAEVSAKANTSAQAGNVDVTQTSEAIGTLHNEITQAGKSIEQLDNDIRSIVSILDVISAIAEQTNLLALNAAIEAARAGEQGRGFAVVADEVRTLAQRAQTSTEDIKGMTDRLKSGAIVAVKAMSRGQNQANASVTEAEHAGEVLTEIVTLVREIDSMNEQIAAATHEQSAVAEEVSRNAMKISDIYVNTQEAANKISDLNMSLHNDATDMNEQVSKFILSSKS